MKKGIFILMIAFLLTGAMLFAQSENNSAKISNCEDLLKYKNQITEKFLADSTVQENQKIIYKVYLDCGIETLADYYSCSEIAALVLLNFGDFMAVLDNLNEEAYDRFSLCTDDKLGPFNFSDLGEIGYNMLLKICSEFVDSDSITFKNTNQDKFCDCFIQKIINRDITYSYFNNEFMDELADNSSVVHNEIFLDCYYKSSSDKNDESGVTDVNGPNKIEEIKIYDLGTRKVKVKIGEQEKYFDLDTGAEETVIPKKMAERLQKDGLVIKYLTEDIFSLADGSKVLCDQMVINNFHIGSFTVNNVTVVVPKEGEGSFLLGLSFLNKFKWSIDAELSKLILEKK